MDVILKNDATYNYQISSDSLFKFDMPVFNDTTWLIKIYNGDNPPLTIVSVATAQEIKKIVTYLEAGKQYHILMNSATAVKPLYDLQNFSDSIPTNLPVLTFGTIEQNNNSAVPGNTIFTKDWLWPVLIFVLAILAFFTWRLAKDIQKKNKNTA